jgi:serine phosphatase RsbU (regulator of sigma subunit)
MPRESDPRPPADTTGTVVKRTVVDMLSPGVIERSRRQTVASGECIVREGDPGSCAFILLSGACDVIVHGEVLSAVRPGEFFGDIAFIEQGLRTATVRAASECEILELAAPDLRSELQRSPELLDEFLHGLARRVRNISRRETRIRDEQRDLRRVMENLQPPLDRFQHHPLLSVDVRWRPLSFASGDYYDVLELAPNQFLFAVGDVMGHGASTTPIFGMVRGQLHEVATAETRPHGLLAHLHKHLLRYGDPTVFMTLALLQLDLEASTAEFAVAGPPSPLFYRDKVCRPLTTQLGWTLGYPFDGIAFSGERMSIMPGDAFLFYSDGVSDATGASGADEELLGTDRLCGWFAELCASGTSGIADALFERVDRYRSGRPAEDDATLMVVTRR